MNLGKPQKIFIIELIACLIHTHICVQLILMKQSNPIVHQQLGFPQKKSTELVEQLIETIKTTLASGEDVLISGFGKFCVNDKKERRGRNPATGEDMMLRPRRVVTFKCSGKLRRTVNS
jgi:integration host factor subunit alpha